MSIFKDPSLSRAAAGGVAVGVLGLTGAQWILRKLERHQEQQNQQQINDTLDDLQKARDGDRVFLGIDLGGTTISVGVVDDGGAVLGGCVQSTPLGDDHDPKVVVSKMREQAQLALQAAGRSMGEVVGIGVCTPGLLNVKQGIVDATANLRGWVKVPITKLVAKEMDMDERRVVLDNDANTALLAEVWVGAARGKENVVMLTLGTGVGGAMFCDGRLLRGSTGAAGELGHQIVVPDGRPYGNAGVGGILEAYASAGAVAERAIEGGVPPNSSLAGCSSISCADVFQHAKQGDAHATHVVKETARYLAIGCINASRNFDCDMVVFTGGMAQAGEQLFAEVREQYRRYHWNIAPVRVELKLAEAGNNASVIGSAYAARAAIESQTQAPKTPAPSFPRPAYRSARGSVVF